MATGDADEIEEERRLLYVALTRAKNNLYVRFPLRYYHRPRGLEDGHGYAQISRFLPTGVRDLFEQRSTPGGTEGDPHFLLSSRETTGAEPGRDVASYLHRLLGPG